MQFFKIIIVSMFLLFASGCLAIESQTDDNLALTNEPALEVTKSGAKNLGNENHKLPVFGLKTNTAISEIDLKMILSGGPGKDGIPSIDKPKFTSITEANFNDNILGIFVEFEGEKRFYPYNILVWHEIINDSIGDTSFAVTFCPLCGSAIVFDRNINGEVRRFGVSGLLYESNLLMYDDKNESLWSQAIGRAVVGDDTGRDLAALPMQLITFAELKEKHSNAQVLSKKTGYSRDYSVYPYGDYEESSRLVFPVSIQDKRFFEKEIMYVLNVEDKSVALLYNKIPEGKHTVDVAGKKINVNRTGGEITVMFDGKVLPGYFEMWFSWATHHQEDGIVVDEF